MRRPLLTNALALAATLYALAAPAEGALKDGLVSYWPFELAADGKTADAASSNHMSLVGGAAIAAGKNGSGLVLNGTSSYLTNLHAADRTVSGLPIYPAQTYTVAMWVKGAPQTARYLFAEGSTTSNNPLLILQTGQAAANNSKLDVIIRNDASTTLLNHVVSSSVVFDNNWHHVVWVDNRGEVSLYVDGVLDSTAFSYTPAGAFTMNTTAIGTLVRAAVATAAIFNGGIDDVAVWSRALSEAEVNELMTTGISFQAQVVAPTLEAPLTNVTAHVGDWIVLTPSISGTRPFSIQWSKNGSPVADATNETFRILNLQTNNSGDFYSVQISNSAGSVTSSNAIVSVTPDPTPEVRTGLMNYWPLDTVAQEGTELRSPDLYSGNDMVLVDFSGPGDTVEGKVSNALSFDFVSRFAYRTNGGPVYNNTNFTVAFWVKAPYETQNDRRVFSEGSSENNNPLFAIGTDGTGSSPSVRLYIRGNSGTEAITGGRLSTRPVFDDTWHHVVWTDANGDARLYVDGMLDETDFRYTRLPATLDRTALGAVLRAVAGNFFYGTLDEVVTWNRALSWTEVQQVMTNGIPPRIAANPPSISAQPVSRTNNVFSGDDISFTVQYAGTLPLNFQWFKDGQPIPLAQNASAATETLTLTNLQPSASGELYVVITNAAGAVTSSVARLEVAQHTPATSGEVLKLDVGLTGSPNLQPGFSEFNLGMNGTNFNGIGVSFSGIGGAALADRNRTTGARITNNPPAMTQAQIYNDFIFANNATDGTGMRITISRLAPNTPYELTLWSYDPQSTGGRFADWNETSSGTPVPIQIGYTFDGAVQPTNDFEQTMTATLTSSAKGQLVIEATRNGGTSVAAFVNAIRLVANPGSSPLTISGTRVVNGKLRITVEAPQAGQTVSLEQRTDVTSGSWATAAGANIVEQNGRTVVFEVSVDQPRTFYRAVVNP